MGPIKFNLARGRAASRACIASMTLFFLSSCSKPAEIIRSEPQVIQSTNTTQSTIPDHAEVVFDNAYAFCSDTRDCPEALAMVTFFRKGVSALCTGFLISPNQMITSSACTQGKMRVHFAETPLSPAETLEASKVLLHLGESAVIELSRASNRKPFHVNRSGIPDQTELKIYTVSPQSESSLIGAIKSSRCVSIMNSQAAPQYQEPLADQITLSQCKTDSLIAGAPLIDPKGEVRAIFSFSTTPTLSLARNLACLSGDWFGDQNPDCLKPRIKTTDRFDRTRDLALAEIQKRFEAWSEEKQQRIPVRFKLGPGGEGGFAPIPECFTTRNLDSDSYAVSAPLWLLIPRFDEWERPYFQAATSPENFGTTLNFSVDTLRATGSTPLIYKTGLISEAVSNFTYCSDTQN